jgi:Domain of unknown function (DUF74).
VSFNFGLGTAVIILGVSLFLLLIIALISGVKYKKKEEKVSQLRDIELKLLSIPNFRDRDDFEIEYYPFHTVTIFTGVSWVSEIFGNWANTWGGKSETFAKEFNYIRKESIKQFKLEVKYKYPNCNVVLNFKLDFHPIVWRRGIMYTITLSGTPAELFIPMNSNNSSEKTEEEKEREKIELARRIQELEEETSFER